MPSLQNQKNCSMDPEGLAKCLLNNFKYISIGRFHKLSFISDYNHYQKHGNSISGVSYELVLDGCFSEVLQDAAEDIESVQIETVSFKDGDMEVFSVTSPLHCELSDSAESIVEDVVSTYGEAEDETINRKLRNIELYQKADFENKITLSS